jgi:TldD protein
VGGGYDAGVDPEELTELALRAATAAGAGYADARWVRQQSEAFTVTDDRVEDVDADDTRGLGVRVLVDGCWGFAATARADPAAASGLGRRAVEIARASALLPGEPVRLAPVEPAVATWATALERDPFAVPLADRVGLLLEACAAQRTVAGLALAQATLDLWRRRTLFASTEGARIDQTVTQVGAGIEAVASGGGDLQRRTWPNSFRGHYLAGGWEAVLAMDLAGHGERVAREALELLAAPELPERTTTVILDGQQLALQVHESVGHALELDRILGMEAGYAGTSFVATDDRGRLRYGSPRMTVTADATTPEGLGTFGFDDEGVPAQRSPLVVDGTVEGFLTSRETAAVLGGTSGGTMRADGWGSLPLIRMTNVNLEPGEGTLEELIADTADGLLLSTNRSWSIDDRRVNFQFATEAAWEITGGRLGRLYKNPTYDGRTTELWGSLDAVCGPAEWKVHGTPNCGKGQPAQVARVSHGVAPGRFHDVHVGVGGR